MLHDRLPTGHARLAPSHPTSTPAFQLLPRAHWRRIQVSSGPGRPTAEIDPMPARMLPRGQWTRCLPRARWTRPCLVVAGPGASRTRRPACRRR